MVREGVYEEGASHMKEDLDTSRREDDPSRRISSCRALQ